METKILNDNQENENVSSPNGNDGMLPVGTMLCHDKYRIVRHIASGGFGNTYEVEDTAFNARFVVKELFVKGDNHREGDSRTVTVSNPDKKQLFEICRRRFGKEAKRLFQLRNDHIVRVYDLFEENGTDYYVMDFVEGVPVSTIIRKRGKPFSEKQTMEVMEQMVDALETVHKEGIWHLDIKPSNIMVDKSGKCVLIDFGASKQTDVDGASTTSASMAYTPGYAPVEQTGGSRDSWGPWTDFYALGATAYNIISGKKPPLTDEILTKGEAAFDFPETVSQGMRTLIVQMMQVAYNKRPQNVDEVRQLLSGCGLGTDTPSVVEGKTEEDKVYTENDNASSQKVYDADSTRIAGDDMGNKSLPHNPRRRNFIFIWTLVILLVLAWGAATLVKSCNDKRDQEELIKPIQEFTDKMINATPQSRLALIQGYNQIITQITVQTEGKEPIAELALAVERMREVHDSLSNVMMMDMQHGIENLMQTDSLQQQMPSTEE